MHPRKISNHTMSKAVLYNNAFLINLLLLQITFCQSIHSKDLSKAHSVKSEFGNTRHNMASQGTMVGGLGDINPATEEVQGYIDEVKLKVEEAVGRTLGTYTATVYRTQLVNGTNYFVKVDVGGNKFVHVRLHRTFSGEVTFASCQDDKTKDDELTYF
ncbi:cystatin-A2-like [Asterias amurensis]|uniref:cystatin-A2-like n=1 Tax=Asterias amurensis TaxID=7602 RepID=UPI003AB88B1C